MYAILQQSGHQYRVSPGDRLVVDRLTAEVGSVVALEPVVLVAGDDGTQVGTPVVDGVRIAAVVVSHRKGAKIRVFKYKPKKRYRRTHGHRSALTELRVEAVLAAGEPLPKPKAAEAKAEKPAPKAEKPARSRAKAAKVEAEAPTTETAEAPEAWGTAEPEETKASAPEAADTGTAEAAGRGEAADAAPEKPKRTRTKKTPSADAGETPEA